MGYKTLDGREDNLEDNLCKHDTATLAQPWLQRRTYNVGKRKRAQCFAMFSNKINKAFVAGQYQTHHLIM